VVNATRVGMPNERGRARWVALLAAVAVLVGESGAQSAKEYQVKAVFLYKFAEFVEWPKEAFPDATAPLIIGVLGRNPFGPSLDEAVANETVNGRPLVVQRYRRSEEITTCHILFISESEAPRLEEIFAELKGRSILTVGDVDGFALRGGMVRLAAENGKTQMRINLQAAKISRLTISSKLLRAAIVVAPGKD
jgi:hypothetical protein